MEQRIAQPGQGGGTNPDVMKRLRDLEGRTASSGGAPDPAMAQKVHYFTFSWS